MSHYQAPYTVTPSIVQLISTIGEMLVRLWQTLILGLWNPLLAPQVTPQVRGRSQLMKTLNKDVQWTSCALDTDEDIALDIALLLLSDEEQQRANKFHFVRDKERYIRGRGFLRQIVAGRLGLAAESLALQKNAFDKPFVAGDPVYFNLSHSEGTAVLALSDKQPIGIDIEFIDRKIDFLEIGRTVFTDNEMLYLQSAKENARGQLFYNFWTAKEAYLKMLGVGMSLEPKKVSLEIDAGRPISSSSDGYPTATLSFIDLPQKGAICCIGI